MSRHSFDLPVCVAPPLCVTPAPLCFSFPDHSLSFHEPRTQTTCPQATEQFKKDADALLAPFGNRIPAGVKGLDAVLSEYVAFKEADARRKKTVASNPLAKRMYDVLEECAAGIEIPERRNDAVADGTHDGQKSRTDFRNGETAFASPSSARMMPPPPARSPLRGKKRGGAAPRRNAPSQGQTHASVPTSLNQSSVFGSLDDDAHAASTWRNYELPRALNDARVQERLAAVIAERIPELGSSDGLSDGVFGKRREDALFAGFTNPAKELAKERRSEESSFASPAKEKRRSPRRTQGASGRGPHDGGSPASGAGVPNAGEDVGGLDVDAVLSSLFDNDADGTLGEILGPLLGMPKESGKERRDAPSPKERASGDAETENAKRRRFSRSHWDGVEAATKKSHSRADKDKDARAISSVPAHVRALDVDAFVKSIEY